MNSNDSSDLNVTTLLALRQEPDALRVITERLKVKEMGPADHIRTKHEAKAFVQSGSETVAESLLRKAAERRQICKKLGETISIKKGQTYHP